jgi:hypothetical protein
MVFIKKNEVENVLDKLNPLNAELNPICHLLALIEAHHIFHVSRIRVNKLKVYYNKYIVISSEILQALGDGNGPYYIKIASI